VNAPAGEAQAATRVPLELLVFNLRTDVADTALGFTTGWVNALARRVDHVSVITMLAGELAVEPNVTVRSLGKERGLSEPRRVAEFYRQLRRVMRERPRIDVCFSHMNPKFSLLFAPVARARGIPQLLWYAHGSVPPSLRAAERVVDRCVTATPASFTLPSRKLAVIGHGIDTSLFRLPAAPPPGYRRTAISIGRISARKQLDEMLEALAIARARGIDLKLELTGEPLTGSDVDYERSLRRRAGEPDLRGSVSFEGPVPFGEVAGRYHRGGLFINLSETRSMDKAILEAMASGCVPISRNQSFRELAAEHGLERLVPGPGAEGLAQALREAVTLAGPERDELVARLRAIVLRGHALDSLSDELVRHLVELAGSRGRAPAR
jgi:glycosyltransferase involved in cell wall biosynthesis